MNEIKLIHAFFDNECGNIKGIDTGGRLWWFRDRDVIKKENDGLSGEVGDLIYPTGWYPLTMRKLESVGDYRIAGCKK